MVKTYLQTRHRLGLIALSLVVAGCADRGEQSDRLSRYQGAPRVQDIYQNRSPEVVRYDRYTLVSTRPADAQRDPLNQIIDVRIPAGVVSTVGQGVRYLLLDSGYSLCSADSSVFTELLNQPLPGVQRNLGPVRLSEGLQILAGPAWRLHVDDVNREVCFVLRDQYRNLAPVPVQTALSSTTSRAVASRAGNASSLSHGPLLSGAGLSSTLAASGSGARNPFNGSSTPSVVITEGTTSPDGINHTVPSPAIAAQTAQAAGVKSAGSTVNTSQIIPAPLTAPVNSAPGSKSNPVKAPSGPVKPVTTLPPAPAPSVFAQANVPPSVHKQPEPAPVKVKPGVPSTAVVNPALIAAAPLAAAPTGKNWHGEAGTTLKETVLRWASEARCENGNNAHWLIVWPVQTDYPIDYPLDIQGNFETVIVQLFNLYRHAKKPLYIDANRFQCVISVSDSPGTGDN